MSTPANSINVSTAGLVKFDGTNTFSTTTITQHDTLVGGASNSITSIAPGTAGQVLTSNGAGADPSYQAASASGAVTQINGDTGSATPTAGVITFNANSNAGATLKFSGSGSTVSFLDTDVNNNIVIGSGAGAGGLSGIQSVAIGASALSTSNGATGNVGIGHQALKATTGSLNTGIGEFSLFQLGAGTRNIAIGQNSGGAFTTTEDSNISIGNNGSIGESHVIRIGTQGSGSGQQNACYVAGIVGTSVANPTPVLIDSSLGQLGNITGNSKLVASNSSGTWASRSLSVVNQTFNANGTYTPTSGMLYCYVRMVGGGAAGGGAAATGAATNSSGSGGGAGEYAEGVFSAATIGASQSVTIGAAGTGSAGAGGGNGGNTSLGALMSANGGTGGAAPAAAGNTNTLGGTGGTGGSGGSFRSQGYNGSGAFIINGVVSLSGQGANSQFGSGGFGQAGANGAGGAATGFGAGGGGANNLNSQVARAGGNGTAGFMVITEYVIA